MHWLEWEVYGLRMVLVTDCRLVDGAELEVDIRGVGQPVLFVQTALTADELLPIAQ
jgi:hypothetical protein